MSALDKVAGRGGRKLTESELARLRAKIAVPAPLADLLMGCPLLGLQLSVPEDVDRSGYGIELQWMDADQMISEATEVYPGKVAGKLGYVPIGICLEGSGDPYFYRVADQSIVRIPHDAATEEGLDEDQVEVVAESIEKLIEGAEIED